MKQKIKLADNFSLPRDAITQKLAFMGRTGSGKTYGAGKFIEQLYEIGGQFIVLDPVGTWWGLRLASDGKNKGIDITIFGGLHGDVPLEPLAGQLMADLVVDEGISAILDVSQFESNADKAKFGEAFASRFFFRKKSRPSAVHLVVEEAQEFIPQNPAKGEERMLGAFERLIKLGRNFGIGASLISQRPQEVNKKALNQTECLFAFQMTGTHERKAVESWVSDKGLDKSLTDILPKLEIGQPHVWSPQWLKVSKIIKIGKKWTFNASSTPQLGARPVKIKKLDPVDIAKIQKEMSATIERAKAEDPKELKREIHRLKTQLRVSPKETDTKRNPVIEKRMIESMKTDMRKNISKLDAQNKAETNNLRNIITEFNKAFDKLGEIIRNTKIHATRKLKEKPKRFVSDLRRVPIIKPPVPQMGGERRLANVFKVSHETQTPEDPLGKCPITILKFLALRPNEEFTREQIGAITGYSPKSGGFSNALSELAVRTLIIKGAKIRLNPDSESLAIEILGDEYNEPEKYSKEIWLQKLGVCPKKIYQVLLEDPEREFTKDEVSEMTGYSVGSGGFNNAISLLCTLGLAERIQGNIRLNSELLEVSQ